jgi:hypothetical protein
MRPSWLHFDQTSKWFAEYAAWVEETSRQNLRDLCRAAEYGVTDAMMDIAFEYDNGFTYFPENDIRSYQWYRRASQSERSQGASAVKWFEDKILSPQQLEEAIRTLDAYETGQCENDLEFLRSHPQMYTVPSSK